MNDKDFLLFMLYGFHFENINMEIEQNNRFITTIISTQI